MARHMAVLVTGAAGFIGAATVRAPLRRTLTVVLYMYKNAFAYQKMGYAATIGVALAILIASVLAVGRRLTREEVAP